MCDYVIFSWLELVDMFQLGFARFVMAEISDETYEQLRRVGHILQGYFS